MFSFPNNRGAVGALTLLSLVLTACSGGDGEDHGVAPIPNYTLGGSVAGLPDGASVQLANNGGSRITATKGNFTFPDSLALGSGYAVTIIPMSIPTGYDCTVTNGSGGIVADVSNVVVNCVAIPTYTLSGTVTGLPSGQSLELRNNDANSVTVTADGAFSFGSFNESSSYAVRVVTVIPGYDCQVSNGSGTLNADVSNVAVNCSVASLRVGGTVTGMPSGQSLQLANNGIDLKTVTADGAFAFDGLLAPASTYEVTIKTGVSGYECMVKHGIGVMSGEVSNVAVSCVSARAWGTADLVEHTDGGGSSGSASTAKIAFDSQGNAIAVWRHFADADTAYDTMVNRYDASTGLWGTELSIEADTRSSSNQAIGIDPMTGNAIVVWNTVATSDPMFASFYTAGGAWGASSWQPKQEIQASGARNTSNGSTGSNAKVAFDTRGNAIAVWYQHDGSTQSIYANRYTAGIGWGTAQLIESSARTASTTDDPRIAFDADGNAIAVWTQNDGAVLSIYANRFDVSAGSWGTEVELSGGTMPSGNPQLSTDANGNAIVVWQQTNEGSGNVGASINARRYVAGSGWDSTVTLVGDSAPISTASGDVFKFSPQIGTDAAANSTVAWVGNDNSIYAKRYIAAFNRWEAAATPIDESADAATLPQIAVDADGNAIVVWIQAGSAWANRYVIGAGWGTAQAIVTSTTSGSPRVAVDANGNAMAIWQQNKGTPNQTDIWFNRFD